MFPLCIMVEKFFFNTHYMILLPEMYGYIKMQIMNCSIKKYLILIGHVFIKVLSMKQVHYLQIFLLNLLNCAYLVKLL